MKELTLILFVAAFVASCSIHYAKLADNMAQTWLDTQVNLGR